MTTNAHILTLDTYLGRMRALVCALPKCAEQEQLKELAEAMTDEIFSAHTDYAALQHQIAELHRQQYEPLVRAQIGVRCRYIDEDAIKKGAYTPEEFEKMLYQACESTANVLGAFLKKYRKSGYLDFHGENKKQILTHLREFCPTMRPYKYKNFAANF